MNLLNFRIYAKNGHVCERKGFIVSANLALYCCFLDVMVVFFLVGVTPGHRVSLLPASCSAADWRLAGLTGEGDEQFTSERIYVRTTYVLTISFQVALDLE